MTVARAEAGRPGPPGPGAVRRRVGPAALVPLALLASGCAGLFGSLETGPEGLSLYDHQLRSLLGQGRYDSAMARVARDRSKAGDELIRLQNLVLVGHHAGRLRESADALEAAVALADDRYTRSVSKAILSAFTNDRILPYRPPPTERLLLHYYGALVHLRLEGPSEAAVEARRLEQRLAMEEDEDLPSGARRDLHVALHRFAAGIFDAAGDRNAADVARRRARRLEGGHDGPSETAVRAASAEVGAGDGPDPEGAPGDASTHGEVLLAVEQGFVAHRVERSLDVLVWPEEMKRLAGEEDAEDEGRYREALSVARRALDGAGASVPDGADEAPSPRAAGATDPGECGVRVIPGIGRVVTGCDDDRDRLAGRRAVRDLEGTPRLLRVAWPEYRSDSRPPPVRVRAAAGEGERAHWSADLSAAAVEEFGERAPEVLAKALLRAVVKNVVAGEVEEEVEEEDESLGEVAGVALNVLGALTERADTRSWSLLPGRLDLVRLRLPAGEHRLELYAGRGGSGERPADTVEVRVRPGRVSVASVRLWR